VLNDLFAGKIAYKEKGNYIVLREQSTAAENSVVLSGYVSDKETGATITYATIYDSTSLASTSSNEYGYYNLTIKNAETPLITVRKEGFRDTTIQWTQSGTFVQNIAITRLASEVDSLDTNDTENAKINWFKRFIPTEEQKAKFRNFSDQLQRKVQVSLVPGIGSNGELSGKTTVDYSFNTIGGFVGGVRVLEIGGVFNLDWDSVRYLQIAGVFNKVGGHQQGGQFAGIANINKADVIGGQFAGITNLTSGNVTGAQFAGLVNNVNGFTGAQFAGIGNNSRSTSIGGQFAGIYNNSEGELNGVQVAGLVNIADHIKGSQIGFININHSIDGVPVGFLSYSREGLHQLEISTNEVFQAQVAFKTGVNEFYNSFIGGIHFEGANPTTGLGYGLGSSVQLNQKSAFFFDLQAMHLQRGTALARPNGLGKFTISYQRQLTPLVAIAFGPSLNFLVTEESFFPGNDFSTLAPYSIYSDFDSGYNFQTWVGGHLSLRFF
jgi:hypothetical protein